MKLRRLIATLLISMLIVTAIGCGSSRGSAPSEKKVTSQATSEEENAKMGELFSSASWLKENGNSVVILDARPEAKYKAGHIPGAINAYWQMFGNMEGKPGDPGWGTLLPKDKLAEKIGALGISTDKEVVVYADPSGWGDDGRIVWMLRMAGVNKSKMLDGGWPSWQAAGGEATKDIPAPNPVDFKIAGLDESMNTTTDWIKANMNNIKVIDARSKKEFDGATDYNEKRGGHLPGAINLPFNEVFKDDGTLKSISELKELFTKAGLKPEDDIVVYCTKGIRSAHATLILRMLGFDKAKNWDASYYEWAGNQKLPVEK